MSFAFTDDERLLAESAEKFLAERYDFAARARILDSEAGFSEAVWRQFAEFGWLALAIPEAHEGLGWPTAGVAVLMEQFGRALVLEPYLATCVLGARAVALAGNFEQDKEVLTAVAEGRMKLAFAHGEPLSRYALSHVETAATAADGGWRLTGHKAVVLHADCADALVVSARTAGGPTEADGITLFFVPTGAEGVGLRPYPTVDGLRAAEVTLDNVAVGPDLVLGPVDGGLATVAAVIDRACVLLAAEAAGAMDSAILLTRDYVRDRQQFGRPIGSFQVLQHRLVDMLAAKEFARALTYRAAGAVDTAEPAARRKAASAAKAETGKAGRLVGQEAIQMHGGMGMSEEMAIGHYFKRLSMIDVQFGNTAHHLRRFAAA